MGPPRRAAHGGPLQSGWATNVHAASSVTDVGWGRGDIQELVAEGRKPGTSANERAVLHSSTFACAGPCRVRGDKLETEVEVSWNQSWTGTRQLRPFVLDGKRIPLAAGKFHMGRIQAKWPLRSWSGTWLNNKTLRTNHFLNLTHCGMWPKAQNEMSGLQPNTAMARLA
jgi:Lipocalin-like domain